MTFHERLKYARTKRKISQQVLSKGAGMSTAYVAQVENGVGIKKPSYEALASMARVLDVPLSWLAEGIGDEPAWPVEAGEDAPASESAPKSNTSAAE